MNATDDHGNKDGCAAIRARLTLYALKDLDARTQETIRVHLEGCEDCQTLAREIEDTLGGLQDALRASRGDGMATMLTAAHRDRIRAAAARASGGPAAGGAIAVSPGERTGAVPPGVRKGRLTVWNRFVHSPVMKIAATVMVGYLLVSLLMPAGKQSRRRAMRTAVQVKVMDVEMLSNGMGMESPSMEMIEEPEPVEVGDISGLDLSFSDSGEGAFKELEEQSAPAPDTTVPPPPLALPSSLALPQPSGASMPSLPLAKPAAPAATPAPVASRPARESRRKSDEGKKSEKPVSMPEEVAAPPAEVAQVRPAEFDSVAMVKSPLILRGVLGSRDPRARQSAVGGGILAGDADDIQVDISDWGADEGALSLRAENVPGDMRGEVGWDRLVQGAGRSNAMPESGEKRKAEEKSRLQVSSEASARGPAADVPVDALIEREAPGKASAVLQGAEVDARNEREAPEGRLQAAGDEKEQTPRFAAAAVNPFVETSANPFSTFSIDVDTASYTMARNYMLGGALPPPEAVRTEEFVNFFDYAYDAPAAELFRVYTEMAPSRFGRGLQLLKIGVKGRRSGREEQRPASLTLLVDTSGSMNRADRIGLVRTALELLLDALGPRDQVALVQFDSVARLLLDHTPVTERGKILEAIRSMQCGGGTNLEAGMRLAYGQAARHFVSKGENRVLLLSDGVANLGEAAAGVIMGQVEAHRQQGLYLSVFGLGMETYDDEMLKTLASKGNGAYAFLDSEAEARRVFVDDLAATLNTIAEDVKIQVEFNPERVTRYRQFGYERRQLAREQFRDDTVDAGEVGSGQSVTALYELDPAGTPPGAVVPYPDGRPAAADGAEVWLAVVRVRYRRTDTGRIEEIEQRVFAGDGAVSFEAADVRFRLAAGVAAFAEILRGSPHVQGVEFGDVAAVLRPVALALSLDSRVQELMRMVETAGGLAR